MRAQLWTTTHERQLSSGDFVFLRSVSAASFSYRSAGPSTAVHLQSIAGPRPVFAWLAAVPMQVVPVVSCMVCRGAPVCSGAGADYTLGHTDEAHGEQDRQGRTSDRRWWPNQVGLG